MHLAVPGFIILVIKFMKAGNHERSGGHAGDMKDEELKRVADIG
jgi:hypothetical protein